MRLSRFILRQFRNISELDLEPSSVLNFLIGDNGQGKTSILEGIYFLSTLKSFRSAKTQDLVALGTTGSLIEGTVFGGVGGTETLKVKLDAGSRKTFVSGKPCPSSKFVTRVRAVVFSPESLAAIKSGPELRRELVDQAVFQGSPQAAQAQRGFSRALRHRNALLKQLRDQLISKKQGLDLLESLNAGYLDLAAEVVFDRLRLLDQIGPVYKEALSNIMGEKIYSEFQYRSAETSWVEREFSEIRHRLNTELTDQTRRVAECSLGLTLTGPHRHDISFLFNGNDSRIFCSQGQQRALILAFKIAEIMYHKRAFGSYPLLLLDDVLSEFDEKKRRYLIDFLRGNEAQTFLTTTDETQTLPGCSLFRVRSGAILLS